MKSFIRWTGEYALALAISFAILVLVDMAKGARYAAAWHSALAWAIISAAILTGSHYWQVKRNAECALCEALARK
jgi:hypothetical protein